MNDFTTVKYELVLDAKRSRSSPPSQAFSTAHSKRFRLASHGNMTFASRCHAASSCSKQQWRITCALSCADRSLTPSNVPRARQRQQCCAASTPSAQLVELVSDRTRKLTILAFKVSWWAEARCSQVRPGAIAVQHWRHAAIETIGERHMAAFAQC